MITSYLGRNGSTLIDSENRYFYNFLMKTGRQHQYDVYQGGHNWKDWQPNFNRVINFLLR